MGVGIIVVANFAALPISAASGQLFETLDTNTIYAYNTTMSTYVQIGGSSGGVDSFNGRTGVVIPEPGDYSAGYIGNVPSGSISATDVQSAINELDSEKQPLDATLTALAAYNVNGLVTQTSSNTFTGRTVVATSSKITVTNGNGISGNPSIDVSESNLTLNNIGGTLNINKGGTGQITANSAFAALSPMTTNEDLIVMRGGVPIRLPVGSDNTALQVVTGVLTYVATPSPYSITSISSNTSAVSGTTYLCDTSGAAFNLTLPIPVTGAFITIKDKTGSFQSNNLTVVRNGSEQIEGLAASKILQTNWGAFNIFSDGTNWFMGPF